MSETQELAKHLNTISGEKKKRKLYQYESMELAKAALLQVKKKEAAVGHEKVEALMAKAEATAADALKTVDSKEQIVDLQLTLLKASLTGNEKAEFDREYERYNKAKQRSQRGLMGSLARQKKLPTLEIAEGKVKVDATVPADSKVQYLQGLEVKKPKKISYTRIETIPAPQVPAVGQSAEDLSLLSSLLNEPVAGQAEIQNQNLLAEMLNLHRLPDGSLEVRGAIATPEAEVQPTVIDISEEQIMAAMAEIPVTETLVREQQDSQIADMIAAYDLALAAQKKEAARAEKLRNKEEKRQKVRNRLRSVVQRVSHRVTGHGLLKAARNLSLPVLGASLPVMFPDIAHLAGNDQILASVASGATIGLLSTQPIREISRAYKNRNLGRKSLKRFTRSLGSAALAGLLAITVAHDTDAFRTLGALEASFANTAEAAESRDPLARYAPAELAFSNPSEAVVQILQGRLDINNMIYVNSIPVEVGENQIVQTPAMPIIFTDNESGRELFRYSRAIMDPVTEGELPPSLIPFLNAIEELPSTDKGTIDDEQINSLIQAVEAEIGPLSFTPADVFIGRLTKRNTWDRIQEGQAAQSGASTVDAQMVKEAIGYAGMPSIYNPDIKVNAYHTEKYNPTYLVSLIKAIRKGEVLDPSTLDSRVSSEFVEPETLEIVAKACEQLERYMYGKLLAQQPDFVVGYLNNIRMGAIRGREIIGINGASEVFFNTPVSELTPGEQVILISSIPQISRYIRALDYDLRIEELEKNTSRTLEQDQKLSELKQALTENQYTSEDLRNAALANVTQIERDGIFQTEVEKQALIAEINAIFDRKDYFMKVPEAFDNGWLSSEAITGEFREEVEAPLLSSMSELAHDTNVVLSREGVVVQVDLPDTPEAFTFAEGQINFRSEAALTEQLKGLIESGMEQKEENGMRYYEVKVDGKTRRFPAFEYARGEFVPGVGVVVVDQSGEVVAKYDQTGGMLVDAPIQVGSTMKPLIYAFGRYVGAIKGPDDMTNDTPGKFGTAEGDFQVVNAMKSKGKLTWRAALSESRNVPFMRFMHDYLYKGTGGMSEADKRAEVQKRMMVFQQFAKDFYGVKVVTVDGREILDPGNKDTLSELFPIGTDAYMEAADSGESSLGAMAGVFLRMEDPQSYFADNEKMLQINSEIPKILKPLGMDGKYFHEKGFDESWAKTGTVYTAIGTTGTLTAFVVKEGPEIRVVYVHLRGQQVEQVDENDPSKDLAKELDMDIARKLTGMGNESFLEAHPYAKWLAKETLKMHADQMVPADDVVDALEDMAEGTDSNLSITAAQLITPADLVTTDGTVIESLPQGAIVDMVGDARDGLQPVAISRRTGETSTVITGFIETSHIGGVTRSTTTEIQEILTSDSVQEFIDTDHFFTDNSISFLVVDKDSRSPSLASMYQLMVANNDLVASSDRLNQILPEGTLVINGDRLNDFTKDRSEGADAMLARELKQAAIKMQLLEAIHSVDPTIVMDELIQDRNAAPSRLMDIIVSGAVPGDSSHAEQRMLLQLPMIESNPFSGAFRNMRQVQSGFNEIMESVRAHKTPDKHDVDVLVQGLRLLEDPSDEEKEFLGIAD